MFIAYMFVQWNIVNSQPTITIDAVSVLFDPSQNLCSASGITAIRRIHVVRC